MTLITNAAELRQRIRDIYHAGRKIDGDIHVAATSCMFHAGEHGDVTLFERLLDAMPKSSRRVALITWGEMYFPITVNRKTGKTKLKPKRTAEDWQHDVAQAVPFWEASKEEAKPVEQKVETIRNYLERLAQGGSEKKPATEDAMRVSKELMATLDRLVATA